MIEVTYRVYKCKKTNKMKKDLIRVGEYDFDAKSSKHFKRLFKDVLGEDE